MSKDHDPSVVPERLDKSSPLKRVHSMGFEYGLRNFTVYDIQQLKGKRQLTEVGVFDSDEAHAAANSGVDLITTRFHTNNPNAMRKIRAAAPQTFMFYSLPLTTVSSCEQARRLAFDAMEAGADSIICQWSPRFIEAVAETGVPVRGHIGLVPRRSTWTGGLKPVGKTVEQAVQLFQQLKNLESSGAWAVECEVIPSKVLAELSRRTTLVTVSLGSGPSDVQFLFAQDIVGDGNPPFPRHSKQYCNLQALRDQMQAMRCKAFSEFASDVRNGQFPSSPYDVCADDQLIEEIITQIDA